MYIEWSDKASELFKSALPDERYYHRELIDYMQNACETEAERKADARVYHETVQDVLRAFIVEAWKQGVRLK